MWEPQLALAECGWRILAPQLRGMGSGGSDPPATSMDDYAGDAIDLLDALHIEQAVVGGLSMGGYVAFAMFRHAPRYVRGLVLADTRPQADAPETVEARKRMLALLRDKGPVAVAEDMMPRLFGSTTHRERPELADTVRRLISANSVDAIAGAITALMTRPDSTTVLGSIHCPTLVLVGEEDAITPVKLSEEMQQAVAGAELAIIPRAGHLSNLEQPDGFNAALERFLNHRV